MFIAVKAAPGRYVVNGIAPMSPDVWQMAELTGDLVLAIKNGDVIEGTPTEQPGGGETVSVTESLEAAEQANEEAAAAAAEAAQEPPTAPTTEAPTESPADQTP